MTQKYRGVGSPGGLGKPARTVGTSTPPLRACHFQAAKPPTPASLVQTNNQPTRILPSSPLCPHDVERSGQEARPGLFCQHQDHPRPHQAEGVRAVRDREVRHATPREKTQARREKAREQAGRHKRQLGSKRGGRDLDTEEEETLLGFRGRGGYDQLRGLLLGGRANS